MHDDFSQDAERPGGTEIATGGGHNATPDLSSVWAQLIEDLPPNQRAWLAASRPVTIHENTAIVAVADDFTRNQLEGRLRTRLEDSLTEALGQHVRIAVTVDPELDPTPATRYGRHQGGSATDHESTHPPYEPPAFQPEHGPAASDRQEHVTVATTYSGWISVFMQPG